MRNICRMESDRTVFTDTVLLIMYTTVMHSGLTNMNEEFSRVTVTYRKNVDNHITITITTEQRRARVI